MPLRTVLTSSIRRPFCIAVLVAAAAFGQTASSVTLSASPNPSVYGQAVVLTATVAAGATGKVTFYDGVIVLGTARVANGTATLSPSSLAAGRRRLRAYYLGDTNFSASTSTVFTHTGDELRRRP
jgi:hypothetical protein